MVDISVIVPIFKVEKYLNKCIEGLLSQTHKNFELILVNDGSPDNCANICDSYSKVDNRVRVIHQPNQGTGIARNAGLEIARGKYIYFCDPDDHVEANLLEDNFKLAELYKANVVLFGYCHELHTKPGKKSIPKTINSIFLESKREFREKFEELYNEHVMYTLWNKLYRKDFLDKNCCRFTNKKVGQDTEFNYKIYRNLDRVYINDQIYYHYVIDRTDSAVNLYRQDRFQLRYEETLDLEYLIESWGYKDKYKQVILSDWVKTLSKGLDNLLYENSGLDDNERKKQIENFISTPKIDYLLKELNINKIANPFHKSEVFLLRNQQVVFCIYLLKVKKFLMSKVR